MGETTKPIETIYNGQGFSSRLEARWAVFFDAMGIEYKYKPLDFRFEDGTELVPNFIIFVKCRSCRYKLEPIFVITVDTAVMEADFFEDYDKAWTKPQLGALVDWDMVERMSAHHPVLVLGSVPKNHEDFLSVNHENWRFHSYAYLDGDDYHVAFSEYNDEIWLCGWDHDQWDGGKKMDEALMEANHATEIKTKTVIVEEVQYQKLMPRKQKEKGDI